MMDINNIDNILAKYIKEKGLKSRDKLDLITIYSYLIEYDKKYIDKIKSTIIEILEENDYMISSNIYGYGRIAYILKHLIKYDNDGEILLDKIDNIIKSQIYSILEIKNTEDVLTVRYYDIFYGLSGSCKYLLLDANKNKILIEKILDKLIKLAEPLSNSSVSNLNKYYIENKNIIGEDKKELYPNGYLDLGLAHGLLGPLLIMAECYDKGIVVKNQLKAIKSILDIYKNEYFLYHELILWHKFLSKDLLHENQLITTSSSRPSWCYGVSSTSRILYIVSTIINDSHLKNLALQSLKCIVNLKLEDLGFTDIAFCHGYSGLYHILNLFYKEVGMDDFKKYSIKLKNRINAELFSEDFMSNINDLSIVDGLASILIPLIIDDLNFENDIFSNILFLL